MAKKAIATLTDGTEILRAGEGSSGLARTNLRATIPAQAQDDATKRVLATAALWGEPKNSVIDNVKVPEGQRPAMTDERFINVEFRAISQVFLQNRGLDFSKPGVLDAAVPLLAGKTIYPNHEFRDIYNWLGVVSESFWDAAGAKSEGVPGINVRCKIDAFLNYRIACGLMMDPPAVNSMSVTVVFEFEYSHPQMERWRFWELLGEEVDGEIVRLIVTKIVEFWEASFVPVGEDRKAKHQGQPDDGEGGDEEDSFGAAKKTANSTQEKTMKLTNEQKTKLGIEFDGDDVPETEIFKAAEKLAAGRDEQKEANIETLKKSAALADKLLGEKRAEVIRLAKIAELGSAEGDLDAVVLETINDAGYERLASLHDYYQKKAADKVPAGRSSVEDTADADAAAGGDIAPLPPVTMF